MVKNLPAMQETWVWSLGFKDPLEKGMTTHSSILAWSIPWTEGPGGLLSTGSQRVRHNWMIFTFTFQPRIWEVKYVESSHFERAMISLIGIDFYSGFWFWFFLSSLLVSFCNIVHKLTDFFYSPLTKKQNKAQQNKQKAKLLIKEFILSWNKYRTFLVLLVFIFFLT